MSKGSRRRQRADSQPTTAASDPTAAAEPAGGRPAAGPVGPARVGRRQRNRPAAPSSFLERYRSAIIGAAVVAVIAVAGVGVFAASSQPVYACSTQFDPTPTPTPGASASPQPGYPQPDMGQGHVSNGTALTYTYCPPASGRHYNGTQTGPIGPRVYGPDDVVIPQGWIHNLEHGALVVLYRGDGDGATEAGQAAMRAFFDRYPASPVCGFAPGTSVGPVFARFDDMPTPFAALVWGRVLPLPSLDETAILAFDQAYGERTNPESFCARPTPSPTPTLAPSPTVAPSAS